MLYCLYVSQSKLCKMTLLNILQWKSKVFFRLKTSFFTKFFFFFQNILFIVVFFYWLENAKKFNVLISQVFKNLLLY